MKTRVITGIIMGIVLIPILVIGGIPLVVFATLAAYFGTYELVKMHHVAKKTSKKYQFIVPIFSSMIVLLGLLQIMLPSFFTISDLVFFILVLFVLMLVVSLFNSELKTTDFMLYFSFILYCGLGIYFAVRIRFIEKIDDVTINYLGLVLFTYLLLATIFTDIGAYTVGILCGRHKLCPKISPKKTIEGAIGGSVFGTLFSSTFLILMQKTLNFSLFNFENNILNIILICLISLVITIFAQFGDLVASKLKREYGIKDYGKIFPGHGGVMDRFDSLIITGSIFSIILILLGVIIL